MVLESKNKIIFIKCMLQTYQESLGLSGLVVIEVHCINSGGASWSDTVELPGLGGTQDEKLWQLLDHLATVYPQKLELLQLAKSRCWLLATAWRLKMVKHNAKSSHPRPFSLLNWQDQWPFRTNRPTSPNIWLYPVRSTTSCTTAPLDLFWTWNSTWRSTWRSRAQEQQPFRV